MLYDTACDCIEVNQTASYVGINGKEGLRTDQHHLSIERHLELLPVATTQRRHHRRHARPVPSTHCTTLGLCEIAAGRCAAVERHHTAPLCLRWPLPHPYTSITSEQMHINPSVATRKDTAEGTKAAIATASQQTGAEGRMLEGRHNQA